MSDFVEIDGSGVQLVYDGPVQVEVHGAGVQLVYDLVGLLEVDSVGLQVVYSDIITAPSFEYTTAIPQNIVLAFQNKVCQLLFEDDFETGDDSKWDSNRNVTVYSTGSPTTGSVIDGQYSAYLLDNGAMLAKFLDWIEGPLPEVYIAFTFQLPNKYSTGSLLGFYQGLSLSGNIMLVPHYHGLTPEGQPYCDGVQLAFMCGYLGALTLTNKLVEGPNIIHRLQIHYVPRPENGLLEIKLDNELLPINITITSTPSCNTVNGVLIGADSISLNNAAQVSVDDVKMGMGDWLDEIPPIRAYDTNIFMGLVPDSKTAQTFAYQTNITVNININVIQTRIVVKQTNISISIIPKSTYHTQHFAYVTAISQALIPASLTKLKTGYETAIPLGLIPAFSWEFTPPPAFLLSLNGGALADGSLSLLGGPAPARIILALNGGTIAGGSLNLTAALPSLQILSCAGGLLADGSLALGNPPQIAPVVLSLVGGLAAGGSLLPLPVMGLTLAGGLKAGGNLSLTATPRPQPVNLTLSGGLAGEGALNLTVTPLQAVELLLAAIATSTGGVLGLTANPMPQAAELLLNGGSVMAGTLWPQLTEYYETWVLTGDAFNPSFYSSFRFNSYCRYRGQEYAAGEDGIYLLGGEDDAGKPIHAGVRIVTNFGTRKEKRLRGIYLGQDGDAAQVRVEDDAGQQGYFTPSDHRVVVSRDLQSKQFILDLVDFETFNHLEINVLSLVTR